MTRPISPEDLWSLARVGQPEPLPDGSAAIVPVTTHDLDADRGTTQLHLVFADGTSRQLTTAEESAEQPSVDPAGSNVAFLRKPGSGEEPQLHLMPLDGGEPRQVTELPLGAGPTRWLPDGSGLIIAVPLLRGHANVDATAVELQRREDDPVRAVATEDRVYRYWDRWLANGRIHHLFHLDLASGELRDLLPGLDRLLTPDRHPTGAFDVSPDGAAVAFTMDVAEPAFGPFRFAVHVVELAGGSPRPIAPGFGGQQRRPRFSRDGHRILFGVQFEPDFYADRIRLARTDVAGGDPEVLTEDWDRSASGWEFLDAETIVLSAEDEGTMRLFTLGGDGEPEPLTGEGSWHGPRPAGGITWCRHESSSSPPDLGIVADGSPRRLEAFNKDLLSTVTLGDTATVEVDVGEARPVQVQIVYPPHFDDEQRWPLLHNIHGGPHGVVTDSWHWRWNTHVFAAAGYVVASVNFHGSSSWGDDFTRSIRGSWGDKPARDVLAVTDHLLDQGFIDSDRMAIAGGSYGGYLVTWLTTVTDRFACAVCHAGVTDLLGQWASDVTEGRERAVGGVPWEDMDAVLRWSPLAHTENLVTPTLVVHGERDYRVVVTQGLALYGILKHKGVPARLVYYPDEGHWIEKPRNSLYWYGEFLSWLERWIDGGPSDRMQAADESAIGGRSDA